MTTENILLLDDDNSLRFNMEIFLSDEGYNVKSSANAEDALSLMGNDNFKVAIVDIRLPGMNGEEFIKQASAIKTDMKFIIYTGSIQYDLPQELRNIGMTDSEVFIKPIRDLYRILRKIEFLIHDKD